MKETKFYTGHRWSNDELKQMMAMWAADDSVDAIATALNSSRTAVLKMVQKLRKNGIPLKRRTPGNNASRAWKPWTQEEISFLIRRRGEKATVDQIAFELGRTVNAATQMIQVLRRNDVPVPMFGQGVRRLWDANELRVIVETMPNVEAEAA